MLVAKKKTLKDWGIFLVLVLLIVGGLVYYVYFFTPKNSLELYQELSYADNFEEVQKLILDGYEDNFTEVDFEYIQGNSANHISQFTIFEYSGKSYVIMTSPGTERLKVLGVEQLPEDIRVFFLDMTR